MKKLLILGISGLTGYKIAKQAISEFEIYGTYNKRSLKIPKCSIFQLDITNKSQLSQLFSEIKPDLVINTTALHNVDFCEEHQEQAALVNSTAVSNIRENAEKHDAKLVHISTDYVFA